MNIRVQNAKETRVSVLRSIALCAYASKLSNSESQSELEASDGMRRSPRGDSETEPTFGPSGIAERLNCCEKNLR